jgi:uncharacterized protein (DUF1499 family)
MVVMAIVGALAIIVVLGIARLTPWWDDLLTAGDYRAVDFETLVLTAKPNQYLVCPPNLCAAAQAHRESPEFDRRVADLRAAFETLVHQSAGVTQVADNADSIDLVARTPIVRWPDWVTVRFIGLGEGRSTLAVYSRSVYGRKDFGANERRITAWLAKLSATP